MKCPLCDVPGVAGTFFADAALIEPVLAAFSEAGYWDSGLTDQGRIDANGVQAIIEDHDGHRFVRHSNRGDPGKREKHQRSSLTAR